MHNSDENTDNTIPLEAKKDGEGKARYILLEVYNALKEKGYHPRRQLTGYLMSGEPVYITSHRQARSLITKIDREELIEELVKSYIEHSEAEDV